MDNYSVRLSEVGQREEALAASEEAVTSYRRQALANPALYERYLARSLSN
ncbi:hypothetical protein [Streptomyces capitiformicae]|uniref:Uncharacterized protein n=1 Tax=Streptomyces capitiformicae TaxID=2014920 RepID=A0A918ZSJ4_9ACTN|nr:hypothetical protein [Streptomyces capitiformicae]GHE66351.1 hypothetical protein GCM10017771_90070 [Streptomyces capitiformicae]